jgi:uncharacterized protein YidB (DUF937 family)
MKKLIAAVTTAGLLTLGLAGTAFAAGGGGSSNGGNTATTQTAKGTARHPIARRALRTAVKTAADTIGVQPKDLLVAVKGGQTVGEFADSKGVPAKTVVDAIVKALDDKIDKAVTDGKLDAARADKLKARVRKFADRVVNTHPKRFANKQAPSNT